MAVAYESVATTAFGTYTSSDNLFITKPTGLAVGDIMVAHLSRVIATGTNGSWVTPSGWTLLLDENQDTDSNSEARLTVFYKVADSSDVAASQFTFETSTATAMSGGALYRISGGASVGGAIAEATGTTNPTFSNTVTPSADSLLLFLTTVGSAGATSGSASTYAIVTDNPTWTERYDFTGDISSRRGLMAGATAPRTQATATGNSSVAYVNYDQNSVGAIVYITPAVSATSTPAVATLTLSVPTPNPAVTSAPTVATITLSVPTPTATTEVSDWVNVDKSSPPTWVNPNKS